MKKKSKNLLIGCGLFGALATLVMFVVIAVGLKACSEGVSSMASGMTAPTEMTLSTARTDPRIADALGGIVEVGTMPSQSINFMNGAGRAELSVPIDGVDRDGTYSTIVEKPKGGEWAIIEATLVIEDGNEVRLDPPVVEAALPTP